jgi:DNA polymerase III epsilon subunit-like protein
MSENIGYVIIDTETTSYDRAFDIGLVLTDLQGNILVKNGKPRAVGYMVSEIWEGLASQEDVVKITKENEKRRLLGLPLFEVPESVYYDNSELWGINTINRRLTTFDHLPRRIEKTEFIKGVINSIINSGYIPVAYNAKFDKEKLENTGIRINGWLDLWGLSTQTLRKDTVLTARYVTKMLHTVRGVRESSRYGVLPTIATSADLIYHFLIDDKAPEEPHTALEDAMDYEQPLLKWSLSRGGNNWTHDYNFWRLHNRVCAI